MLSSAREHQNEQQQTDKHKLVTHNLGDISKVRRSVHVLLLRVMHTTSYLTYITKIKSDRFISLYHIGPVSKCSGRAAVGQGCMCFMS